METKNDVVQPMGLADVPLSNSGACPPPLSDQAFQQLGQVLETVKEQPDYGKQLDERFSQIEKSSRKRTIEQINKWFFDALEKEYLFRKSKNECWSCPEVLDEHFESIKSLFHRGKYE